MHAVYIKWRRTTEQWIAANRDVIEDKDRRSIASRQSRSSKASNRSRRKAQIKPQRLNEENRLQREENEAKLHAIEQKCEAIKRKAQLEIEALGDTDTEIEGENEPPPQLECVTSPRKKEQASIELAVSHVDKFSTVSHPHDVTNTSDATGLMVEAMTQIKHSVRRLDLTKIELLQFSGDCKRYMKFICNFQACVDTKVITENEKSHFLIQNCTDEAKWCIEDCGLYGKDGYSKAKEILKNQYGKPNKNARSFIDKITSGALIEPNDHKALTDLSLTWQSVSLTYHSLTSILT